jgi:hypothetical protein
MKRTQYLGLFLFLTGIGSSRSAFADAAADVSAEALFDEGRRLMAQGQFADACAKFEGSERLDPGAGTMLNLADCYEKLGRTASAWAAFREAGSIAHNAGSADRAQIAADRAKALEARLSTLTIVPWQGQVVDVKRDGVSVDPAMFNTPIPVDPGSHVIVASSPGKRQWSTTVDVVGDAAKVSVAVPILPEDAAIAAAPAAATPSSAPQADKGDTGSTQRTLAIVAGGVGIVGIGVGTIFGLKASSTWSDAKSHCTPYPHCGPEGAKLSDDASSQATVSTVGFVVGAVGLVGGAVLWFTAPKANSDSPKVGIGIGPSSVSLDGRF